jgi:hypothetical protein
MNTTDGSPIASSIKKRFSKYLIIVMLIVAAFCVTVFATLTITQVRESLKYTPVAIETSIEEIANITSLRKEFATQVMLDDKGKWYVLGDKLYALLTVKGEILLGIDIKGIRVDVVSQPAVDESGAVTNKGELMIFLPDAEILNPNGMLAPLDEHSYYDLRSGWRTAKPDEIGNAQQEALDVVLADMEANGDYETARESARKAIELFLSQLPGLDNEYIYTFNTNDTE